MLAVLIIRVSGNSCVAHDLPSIWKNNSGLQLLRRQLKSYCARHIHISRLICCLMVDPHSSNTRITVLLMTMSLLQSAAQQYRPCVTVVPVSRWPFPIRTIFNENHVRRRSSKEKNENLQIVSDSILIIDGITRQTRTTVYTMCITQLKAK